MINLPAAKAYHHKDTACVNPPWHNAQLHIHQLIVTGLNAVLVVIMEESEKKIGSELNEI